MIAVTPKGERRYVCLSDRELPEDQQTEFIIRDLTERERVKIQDAMKWSVDPDTQAVSVSSGTKVHMTLLAALVGTTKEKPLRGEDGEPVEFESSDDFLALLPWSVKEELTHAIHEGVSMTEEEVEKPEPSPSAS